MLVCPHCKTDQIHRSRRRGLIERCAARAGYYPHRCRTCDARFFGRRHSPPADSVQPKMAAGRGSVEREIRATRGALKANRRRRELFVYGVALVLFLMFLYYVSHDLRVLSATVTAAS